jgi:hypothetical protein
LTWRARLDRATRPGSPPPERGRWAQIKWGAAQPLLGLRAIFSRRELARFLPRPLLWLVLICAAYPFVRRPLPATVAAWGVDFYRAFASLAVVPTVLFANHYFRLAARAREVFGLGPQRPRQERLRRSLALVIEQSLILILPIPLLHHLIVVVMMLFGFHGGFIAATVDFDSFALTLPTWINAVGWALLIPWAAQWIVVDALDSARVLRADGRPSDAGEAGRPPRFARWLRWLLVGFGLEHWSKPWWEEFAIAEGQPWIALGFMATTALILAVPVVQFVFRPAIIVAAAHWLGYVEVAQTRAATVDPSPTENVA